MRRFACRELPVDRSYHVLALGTAASLGAGIRRLAHAHPPRADAVRATHRPPRAWARLLPTPTSRPSRAHRARTVRRTRYRHPQTASGEQHYHNAPMLQRYFSDVTSWGGRIISGSTDPLPATLAPG